MTDNFRDPEPELRNFRTPAGQSAVLLCRPGTNDRMMAESALDGDEYGLAEERLAAGVAVDVGAHIGMVSIGLALDNPQARIIAVEPVPENVAILRRNLDLNGLGPHRVTIVEAAAARPNVRTVPIAYRFTGGELEDMHRFVANQPMPHGAGLLRVEVPGVTLAQLVKLAGGEVSLLVTDCEGGEYDLLRGRALGDVVRIVGEYHDGFARLAQLLAGTHHTWRLGDDEGFGGFVAQRRPGAGLEYLAQR